MHVLQSRSGNRFDIRPHGALSGRIRIDRRVKVHCRGQQVGECNASPCRRGARRGVQLEHVEGQVVALMRGVSRACPSMPRVAGRPIKRRLQAQALVRCCAVPTMNGQPHSRAQLDNPESQVLHQRPGWRNHAAHTSRRVTSQPAGKGAGVRASCSFE